MRRRDHEKWIWITLMVIAMAVIIGLTVWPWIAQSD